MIHNSNKTGKTRITNIDYLKFISCLLVMFYHFYCLYYYCNPLPTFGKVSKTIFENFPKPFLDGNFWVCVFCILSGILLSHKKIENIKQLLIEIFIRYLRFFIPIFFSYLLIYFYYKFIGFSNISYATIYNNTWISGYMTGDVYLTKVIKHSLLFKDRLNTTLWCIMPIFIGNILLLIRNYLKNIFKNIYIYDVLTLVILFVISIEKFDLGTIYILLTYIGIYLSNIKNRFSGKKYILFLLIIFPIFYSLVYPFCNNYFYLIVYLNTLTSIIFVSIFLNIKISSSSNFNTSILSSLSFWIYLTHFPIICSFSCSMILLFKNFAIGFWITLILTFVIVILVSLIFVKYFDTFANRIIKNIKIRLVSLFD